MEAKLFGHKIGRLNLPQQLASSVRLPPLRSPAEKSQTILQKALAWWLGRQNSDAEPTFIAARNPLALQDFLNKPLLQRVRPDSFVQLRAAGFSSRTQGIVLLTLLSVLFAPLRNWPRMRSHSLWKLELRRWNVHIVDERMGTPFTQQASGLSADTVQAVSRALPSGRMFGGGASSTRGAILAFEPHGLFPHGPAMGAVYRLGEYLQQFRALGASVVRYLPPVSWLAQTGAGMVPVSRSSIQRHWKRHPQHVLGIVPGGIAEMFYSDTPNRTAAGLPLDETLVLNSRKGFVRLALEQGADIIPVYVFGASQTFRLWPKWLWLRDLSRAIRVFLGVPVGEKGLPAPLKVPLLYAIGEAIQARAFRSGADGAVTEADVRAAHAAFVESMRGLFERYKAVYGWHDTKLRII